MRLSAIILLAACSQLLLGAEKLRLSDVSSLPQKCLLDAVADPVPGRKLSLVFRSAAMDGTKGFKTPSLEWKAEGKDADLESLLRSSVKELGRKDGLYRLELAVLQVADAPRLSFGKRFFILEGRVLAPNGAAVGCFLTKEEGEKDEKGVFTFRKAVQRACEAITEEQFKAGSTSDNSGLRY